MYVNQLCVQHSSVLQVHNEGHQKTKTETGAKRFQAVKEKQAEKDSDSKEKSERDFFESTIQIYDKV